MFSGGEPLDDTIIGLFTLGIFNKLLTFGGQACVGVNLL